MKRVLAGIAAIAAIVVAPGAASAQDDTQITLLHGIPGVTVDVAVGGEVLLPGFEPGASQDLTAFAGQTLADLTVFVAGTEDIAIGPVAEFAVPASGNWTVIAHLDADGVPSVGVFENNTAMTADGQGRLTVRHAAAAPAVDLVVGDARPVENAANGASADLELPAGEIAGAQLAPTGGDPIVDVPTVNLQAGTNLIVYAVGSLADDTFTFLTQEIAVGMEAPAAGDDAGDGTPAPTAVNTGNPISDSANTGLLAAAAAMMVLAGGAFALRHRTVEA
jgi:hypothetical protein